MKVSEKLILSFTENMSVLINSGLSVMESLNVALRIDDSKENVKLCTLLTNELSDGESFYDALRNASDDFKGLYAALIKIGEKTGSINLVLERLSEYLRKKKEIKEKIRSALSYPLIVFVTAFIVILVIMFFVFPKLETVFDVISEGATEFESVSMKVKSTSRLISFSALFLLMSIFVITAVYKKNVCAKKKIDKVLFKIPLVKNYLSMMCTYDFAFSMKLLCSSGVSVVEALEESGHVVKNEYYRKQIEDVKISVSEGNGFSVSMNDKNVFPKYLKTWIGIGETAGNVSGVFDQVYKYYGSRSEYILKEIAGNAESVFILITGIIIFVLVCQFVLPVFSILGRV
ncbi:type II secretion system F family protein [Treponema sp.]|uniref:type II secretion system F family protein n=1 Tax=Treponema sp. TaxID=166 RepID=UPI00298E46B5|nr:type II secretion system F family protein [Treponema sp.]